MSTRFSGRGNLAEVPALKSVEVRGESRQMAQMRVYFDRPVPAEEDAFEDKGGFWLDVNYWGHRAERMVRVLSRGARVYLEGNLEQVIWKDRDSGTDRSKLRLNAEYIALDLSRVESVEHLPRSGQPTQIDGN